MRLTTMKLFDKIFLARQVKKWESIRRGKIVTLIIMFTVGAREKIGPSKKQALIVLQKRKVQIAERKLLDIEGYSKTIFEGMAKSYIETYSKPNKKSF